MKRIVEFLDGVESVLDTYLSFLDRWPLIIWAVMAIAVLGFFLAVIFSGPAQ